MSGNTVVIFDYLFSCSRFELAAAVADWLAVDLKAEILLDPPFSRKLMLTDP